MLLLRVSALSYLPARTKVLHYLSTATSDTQLCKLEISTLQQGFGKNYAYGAILRDIMTMIATNT